MAMATRLAVMVRARELVLLIRDFPLGMHATFSAPCQDCTNWVARLRLIEQRRTLVCGGSGTRLRLVLMAIVAAVHWSATCLVAIRAEQGFVRWNIEALAR